MRNDNSINPEQRVPSTSTPSKRAERDQSGRGDAAAETPDQSRTDAPSKTGTNLTEDTISGREKEIAETNPSVIEEELKDLITQNLQTILFSAQTSSSFAGLLPPPDLFREYPNDIQERIVRMSEASSTDESKRRDKLVEAEIHESSKSRKNAVLLLSIFGILAFVSYLVERNAVIAGVFLSVPVSMVIREFISQRKQ